MNPTPDDPNAPPSPAADGAGTPPPPRAGRFSADDLRPEAAPPARPRLPPRLTDEDLAAPRQPRPANGFEAVDLDAVKQRRAQRLQQNLPPGSPFRKPEGGGAASPRPGGASSPVPGPRHDADVIDVDVRDVRQTGRPHAKPEPRASAHSGAGRGWAPGLGERAASAGPAGAFFEGVGPGLDRAGAAPDGGTRAAGLASSTVPGSAPGRSVAAGRSGASPWAVDAHWLRECAQALAVTAAGVFLLAMGWTYLGAWGVLPLLTVGIWGLAAWSDRMAGRGSVRVASVAALLSTLGVPLWAYTLQIGLGVWDDVPGAAQSWPWSLQVPDSRRVWLPALATVWAWRRFQRFPRPVLLMGTGVWLWGAMLEAAMTVMGRHRLGMDYLAQVTGLYGLALVVAGEWLSRAARRLAAQSAPSARSAHTHEKAGIWAACGQGLGVLGALLAWSAGWSLALEPPALRWAWMAAQGLMLGVGLWQRRWAWVTFGSLGLGLSCAIALGLSAPTWLE